jgi:hypothetical protein
MDQRPAEEARRSVLEVSLDVASCWQSGLLVVGSGAADFLDLGGAEGLLGFVAAVRTSEHVHGIIVNTWLELDPEDQATLQRVRTL